MKNQAGFTLWEVLIALTIGTTLLTAVLSIYGLAAKASGRAGSQSELTQNSRVIVERLTRDIRQARQIATNLPETPQDPARPPPREIEMQDGHNTERVQYIRYYLDGTDLRRQIKQYEFVDPNSPPVFVAFSATTIEDGSAGVKIIEDVLVGQYVANLRFYGRDLITVELGLAKNKDTLNTQTNIYGRNF